MIPIFQTEEHDCMRACIASILEADPSLLPAPHCGQLSHDEWNQAWWDFLRPHNLWPLGYPGYPDPFPEAYVIAWIRWWPLMETAPTRIATHSVVMRQGALVHDPFPIPWDKVNSSFSGFSVLLPIDPSRAIAPELVGTARNREIPREPQLSLQQGIAQKLVEMSTAVATP